MRIFLPYRAEFGFVCMAHAPQVHHTMQDGKTSVVCIEEGNEALYPGMEGYMHIRRRNDDERRQFLEKEWTQGQIIPNLERRYGPDLDYVWPDVKAPRKYFVPQPFDHSEIACDVVICPRKRAYGSDKNWQHWQSLAESLSDIGYHVFAAGAPDSSDHVKTNAGAAWDHGRFLDATIVAMLSAKLVIATDNGLGHLAMMCGRPLALISYKNGLVAPGEDDVGNNYWPIKLNRYQRANHKKARITVMHNTWNDPSAVLELARRLLSCA